MTTLSLTAYVGATYLQSCKKCECQDPSNPDCENYDPCLGKSEVKADFLRGGQWSPPASFFGVDD